MTAFSPLAPVGAAGEDSSPPPNLERALEGLGSGFALLDRDWRFLYANSQAASFCGISAAELVGQSIWASLRGVPRQPEEEHCRRAVATGIPFRLECHPERLARPIELRFAPGPETITVFWTEVTRHVEARQETVLASIGDHIACYDRQWRYTYVNDQAAQLLGKSKEELLGRCIWELFPEAVGSQFYQELHRALAEQTVIRSEHYYAPWDRWFENHIYPSPGGVTVYSNDVTWRKNADRELRESRQRLADTLESIADAFTVIDRDWTITYINDQALRLAGVSRDEALGKTVWQAFPALTGTPLEEAYRRAMEERGADRLEIVCPLSDRWVEISLSPSVDGLIVCSRDIHERKLSELRLQESEERFRLVADSAPVLIWMSGPRKESIYFNRTWTTFTGRSPDEELGDGWLEAVHPEDFVSGLNPCAEAFVARRPFQTQFRLRRFDGEYRWMLDTGVPRFASDGEFLGYIGSCVDFTPHREAEEESARLLTEISRRTRQLAVLSEASQQINTDLNAPVILRSLVAFAMQLADAEAGAAGRMVDGGMDFREYNDGSRILPLDVIFRSEDVEGIPSWVMREKRHYVTNNAAADPVIHPDLREQFGIRSALNIPVFDRRGDLIACFELHNKRGGLPFDEDDVRCLGGLAAAAAVALENARLYEQLRESEARNRQLADNLPNGFLYQAVQRPDGTARFVYVGGSVEPLLGISPEDVAADPTVLHRMIDPEDLPRMRAEEEACMQEQKPFDCQFRVRIKTGEIRWLHCRSAPRPLPDGGAVWDGIAVDITERVQAAEILKDADRRKDEFLAMLAHELRNPLAPIRSGLELLVENGVEDEAIDLMQEQVEHMARLVDDLLDASRIMRNRVQLRKKPVDMTAVVSRAVESVRPLVEAKQHDLIIATRSAPIWVDGDPVRLTQVVTNLLHNAAKYTDRDGRIEVAIAEEGGEAVLRVRDSGIGISADLLPHVFDLFTQADRSLERSQGGLGIGLTLVHHLVALHGGRVTADSDGDDRGSEFTVRLPILPHEAPDEAASPAGRLSPGDHRILIVEDNIGSARLLSRLLAKFGHHEIAVAHDGPSALNAAQQRRPDIILLDIGLPSMNGFEVGRRLRADAAFDDTLLVALTGYGSDEDRRRSREAGFDMHLVKPPGMDVLQHLFAHPKLAKRGSGTPPAH